MAQVNHSTEGHSSLSIEDVRTAVLHLVELAAAYEGRGVEVDEPPGIDADDTKTLREVVSALKAHRAAQRLRQRNAALRLLSDILGDAYRNFAGNGQLTAGDLQDWVGGILRLLGVTPTDAELDDLVIDRELRPETYTPRKPVPKKTAQGDGDRNPALRQLEHPGGGRADVTIRTAGGPVEAAKHTLSRAVGRSLGTIADARRSKQHSLARHAFNRYVPRGMRAAYVRELHEALPSRAANESARLADLGDVGEPVGLVLDLVVESGARLVMGSDDLLPLLVPTLEDKADAIATDFIEGLRAGGTEFLDALTQPLPGGDGLIFVDEDVRSTGQALLKACRDSPHGVGEEEAALKMAIRSSMRRRLREGLGPILGDLDVLPVQVNAVRTALSQEPSDAAEDSHE
jgi:PAS domain-containing protein